MTEIKKTNMKKGTGVLLRFKGKPSISADGIKEIRKSLGLNKREFGALIGASESTVNFWEMGRHPVKGPAAVLVNLIAERGDVRRMLGEVEPLVGFGRNEVVESAFRAEDVE